jgi:hypothetical protein
VTSPVPWITRAKAPMTTKLTPRACSAASSVYGSNAEAGFATISSSASLSATFLPELLEHARDALARGRHQLVSDFSVGTLVERHQHQQQASWMELAGLEPAASWVRYGDALVPGRRRFRL